MSNSINSNKPGRYCPHQELFSARAIFVVSIHLLTTNADWAVLARACYLCLLLAVLAALKLCIGRLPIVQSIQNHFPPAAMRF